MEGGSFFVGGLDQTLGDHPQERFGNGPPHTLLLLGGIHPQHQFQRAHGGSGVEGAEHEMTGLGGLDSSTEGFLVADLTDQDHIRIFAQG